MPSGGRYETVCSPFKVLGYGKKGLLPHVNTTSTVFYHKGPTL